MTETPIQKQDIQAIKQAIGKRYQPPEWFLAWEVAIKSNMADSGGVPIRVIDGVAFSPWRRNGYEWHGLEIKTHRADWLKELKDSSKAIPAMEMCNRWFLVAPQGIVKIDELPATWGLLELHRNTLFTKKPAPLQAGLMMEEQVSYFIGKFFAAYHKYLASERHIDTLRHQIWDEAHKSAKEEFKYAIEQARIESDRYRDMQQKIGKLTKIIGIDSWDLNDGLFRETASQIRAALAMKDASNQLHRLKDSLLGIVKKIDEAIEPPVLNKIRKAEG